MVFYDDSQGVTRHFHHVRYTVKIIIDCLGIFTILLTFGACAIPSLSSAANKQTTTTTVSTPTATAKEDIPQAAVDVWMIQKNLTPVQLAKLPWLTDDLLLLTDPRTHQPLFPGSLVKIASSQYVVGVELNAKKINQNEIGVALGIYTPTSVRRAEAARKANPAITNQQLLHLLDPEVLHIDNNAASILGGYMVHELPEGSLVVGEGAGQTIATIDDAAALMQQLAGKVGYADIIDQDTPVELTSNERNRLPPAQQEWIKITTLPFIQAHAANGTILESYLSGETSKVPPSVTSSGEDISLSRLVGAGLFINTN